MLFFCILSTFLCLDLFKFLHKNRQPYNPKYNSFHSFALFLLYFLFFKKGIVLYCVFVLMTTVPTGKIGSEWTHFHDSLKMKFQSAQMFSEKKKKLTNKKAADLCKEIGIIHFGARTYEIQLYWTLESPNVSDILKFGFI